MESWNQVPALSTDLSTINQCKQTAPRVLAPRLPDAQRKSAPPNTSSLAKVLHSEQNTAPFSLLAYAFLG